MQDETFGNKVVIQMYHNHPPVAAISEVGDKQIVWMRVAWDNNCEEAAQIAGSDLGVAEAYEKMVTQWLKAEFDGYVLPLGPEAGASVFHLLGTDTDMQKLADNWRAGIEQWAESGYVSGDDTYFDYFPDYVHGLEQLCKQINYPEAFNQAHRFITQPGAPYAEGTIGADEDVLPSPL
jgi:hypothetical protein